MDLDEFLGHKTSTPNTFSKTLRWRDRNPARIDTWMHAKGGIVALWSHNWKRLVEREVDGDKVLQVWSGSFNCHESDALLKEQYRRNGDGSRRNPPKVCPMCLVMEWMHNEVACGRLNWTAPAFEFKGTEQRELLTVGGMLGLFNNDKLTSDQLTELRKAGIRRDEAWKQSTRAKCNYVFQIVDNDNLKDGVQVAVETTALGDAVKGVILDQIESLGPVDGNPLRTPYAIRWKYNADAVKFNEKYAATPMPRIELTSQVRELIFDTPPPDISSTIAKGNAEALYSVMQKLALFAMPLDRLFEAAIDPKGAERAAAPQAQVPASVGDAPAAGRRVAKKASPQPPKSPEGTVLIPCDNCGVDMPDTAPACWSCGAEYEIVASAAPPAAPTATEPTDNDDLPF